MIDWLRRPTRDPAPPPTIAPKTLVVGDRELPLVIRRLAHARNMTLRLAPDGTEARISIPRWGRVADAVDFARARADWLAAQLSRIPEREALEPGRPLPYRGEAVLLEWQARAPRRPVLDDGALLIGGPQEGLEPRIRRWLEAEALRLCTQDLAHYCTRAGQAVPRLSLSRAQRRWGSCAADGTIRINWRLIMAPDFVRRSVVAHEVAHMTHFDHSPAFHAHLADIYDGRIADADRWLKQDGRSLYRLFG
ncbi:MAG: hypothetical protein RIS94_3587 [Pseudomonadota bacterium]|jgi:predicted metal-dependent hydrolase